MASLMKVILHYKLTFMGSVLACSFYVLSVSLQLDIFESFHRLIERLEHLEVDELIFPILIVTLFSTLEMRRRANIRETTMEKTKVKKKILRSSHHTLNNFLNRMTLFKMTAERTPDFDPKILELYEKTIHDASVQLARLDDVVDGVVTHDSIIRK
jgi:hypothetical protein